MKFLKSSYNPNSLNTAWLNLQLKSKAKKKKKTTTQTTSFKQLMRKSEF